jgi:hypothetical protein
MTSTKPPRRSALTNASPESVRACVCGCARTASGTTIATSSTPRIKVRHIDRPFVPSRRRLEQLNGIAIRIEELNLLAARTDLDRIAKPQSQIGESAKARRFHPPEASYSAIEHALSLEHNDLSR